MEACIKYGAAQAKEDKIYEDKKDWEKDVKIRPLEMTDFNTHKLVNYIDFKFDDKVVMIFGVQDETVAEKPYPIKQISIERSHIKIIDIVDVEDLYHSNYISFLTPVLYRRGDKATITFDSFKRKPDGLKFMGLVFSK